MKSLTSSAAAVAALLSFSALAQATTATTTTPSAGTPAPAPAPAPTATTTTTVTTTTATAPTTPPRSPFQIRAGFYGAFAPASAVYAKPNTYGIGGIVEPGFAITDWLLIGLRIDAGILVGVDISTGGGSSTNVGLTGFGAGLLKLELGLPTQVRPFISIGAGPYYMADLSALAGSSGAGTGMFAGTVWGAAPEAGFDFGGFRIAALYHYFFGHPQANFFALELSWH